MTYLYEYTINDVNIKVEYTFSTVADKIKVVDMWVDGKDHSVNWMGPEARAKLMTRLEDDMTNRMCGTNDDESYIYDHSIDTIDPDEPTDLPGVSEQDEYFEGGDYNGMELSEGVEFIPDLVDTEVDLDRDMPGFEGTMDALEDMVDSVVGEPEFLGGR
tara:strand:- start:426 stop:902 length:477 start_codon:yes stop_codon:yes gene_type:complete